MTGITKHNNSYELALFTFYNFNTMIDLRNYFIAILLLFIFSNSMAQGYCLEFSKDKKETVRIKEGEKVSFVMQSSADWNKGELTAISSDSLFIEQEITKKSILNERESNFITIAHHINSIDMMAYTNTSSVIKGSATVLLYAVVILMGAPVTGGDEEPTKKIFKKNIDFDEGWTAKIVPCK